MREKEVNLDKISFFKSIKFSMTKISKYDILSKQGIKNAMIYLLKLVLLFSFIITFSSFIKLYPHQSNIDAKLQFTAFIESFMLHLFLYGIIFFLETAIISLLGFLINKILKNGFNYKEIFTMSIYAFTNTIIMFSIYTIIVCITGINVSYMQVTFAVIALIYLMFALLKMKK